jgi:hypothetical protein
MLAASPSFSTLPISVVLTPQSSGFPPDPCIQFNPLPSLAATNSFAVRWQGSFTEVLKETPATTPATPAAWAVDVVYNLSQQPSPGPMPMYIIRGGRTFFIGGTVTETLTPLDASGNPIASGEVWVSKDTISSSVVLFPSMAMNPVANSYLFTTHTTIRQTLTPSVATTATASWTASTVTSTTGTVDSTLGTISLTENINQSLSPVSATVVASGWTISAEFVGSGTFNSATATSETMQMTGKLTGTISPPKGSLAPVQLLNSQVTASVTVSPAHLPIVSPL